MNQIQYSEMIESLNKIAAKGILNAGKIFVFAHCEASLTLIDELILRGIGVKAILDNNPEKQGIIYRNIPVVSPDYITGGSNNQKNTIVLLATRFYEQMNRQLLNLGFVGRIIKLVDYNTYAEYSLSEDTIARKRERVEHGAALLSAIKKRYNGAYVIFCPFNALGDIYFCMSYLPRFLEKKGVSKFVVCVPSGGCRDVAQLFGTGNAIVMEQKELDAVVQAALFTKDYDTFIAHQDRPYVINLHKALKIRKILLDDIYKIGVFGLGTDVKPCVPTNWAVYPRLNEILDGKAAILSPYAKSVTAIPSSTWTDIVDDLKGNGYQVFTNVCGDEKPLLGTEPISPRVNEIRSLAERAGLFIGLRSGLCDVLRTAKCRKIALFPDYYYSDTKWKAIDMYYLPEFENIVVDEEFKWQGLERM